MSDNHDFKDESSFLHLSIAGILLFAMPLLPMLTGWYRFSGL